KKRSASLTSAKPRRTKRLAMIGWRSNCRRRRSALVSSSGCGGRSRQVTESRRFAFDFPEFWQMFVKCDIDRTSHRERGVNAGDATDHHGKAEVLELALAEEIHERDDDEDGERGDDGAVQRFVEA